MIHTTAARKMRKKKKKRTHQPSKLHFPFSVVAEYVDGIRIYAKSMKSNRMKHIFPVHFIRQTRPRAMKNKNY